MYNADCLFFMQMDELACFAPGMLALGSFGYGPDDSKKFLSLAEEVIYHILIGLRLRLIFQLLSGN